MSYQPKTGERCHCKRGVARDNCPDCEGTGWRIDFPRIRREVKVSLAAQEEVKEALAAFPAWMNRPTKRAQVLTFRIAVAMFGNDCTALYRARPQYRNERARIQRLKVAQRVRVLRMLGRRLPLPRYDEGKADYV